MSYFIHFSGYNMPKNKLQTAIVDLFKSKSGHITPNTEAFVKEISTVMADLHTQYPKCKPIQINNWAIDDGVAFGCGNEWTCQIYLYKIKEVENAS